MGWYFSCILFYLVLGLELVMRLMFVNSVVSVFLMIVE